MPRQNLLDISRRATHLRTYLPPTFSRLLLRTARSSRDLTKSSKVVKLSFLGNLYVSSGGFGIAELRSTGTNDANEYDDRQQ